MFREAAWLIRNGLPLDYVDGLYPHEIEAFAVTFSEFEGAGTFDWEGGVWIKPRE